MSNFGVIQYSYYGDDSATIPADCYGADMPVTIGGTYPEEVEEESVNIDKPVEKRRDCVKIMSPRRRIVSPPGGWGFYRG